MQVQEIHFEADDDADDVIDVEIQVMSNYAFIKAHWQFVDPESPVVEYRWAIGDKEIQEEKWPIMIMTTMKKGLQLPFCVAATAAAADDDD